VKRSVAVLWFCFFVLLPADEHEISGVDNKTGRLADNEDGILFDNRIGEQEETSA